MGEDSAMDNIIITISRGYGSNGVAIGKLAAKLLGINYYDDASLREMASSWLRRAMDDLDDLPPEDAEVAYEDVFRMQIGQVRELSERESFVIMGRAADYFLRDIPNIIRISIHSDFDECVTTVAERDGISRGEAAKKIHSIDAQRAEFYQRHTGSLWNDPMSFDLTLNSSSIGSVSCAELIARYVDIWRKHHGFE